MSIVFVCIYSYTYLTHAHEVCLLTVCSFTQVIKSNKLYVCFIASSKVNRISLQCYSQETRLNPSVKGFSVWPAPTCPLALVMGYFGQRCKTGKYGWLAWVQEVVDEGMMRFSTTDTVNSARSLFGETSLQTWPLQGHVLSPSLV